METSILLTIYRDAKITEAALVLQQSPELCQLAVAWNKTHYRTDNLKFPPAAESINELWDCVRIDYGLLEEAVNLSPLQIIAGIEKLKIFGIILPDGTINRTGQAIIQNMVLANIKVPQMAQ